MLISLWINRTDSKLERNHFYKKLWDSVKGSVKLGRLVSGQGGQRRAWDARSMCRTAPESSWICMCCGTMSLTPRTMCPSRWTRLRLTKWQAGSTASSKPLPSAWPFAGGASQMTPFSSWPRLTTSSQRTSDYRADPGHGISVINK